jgi:hypothetical protein
VKRPIIGKVPDEWAEKAAQQKTLMAWPDWPEVQPLATGPKVVTRRNELRTSAAETIQIVAPLGDSREGVRLRIVAWAFQQLREITATLEAEGNRSFVTIARLDGWPVDPHINPVRRNYPSLKQLPSQIAGHHVHRFADNARLGLEAFAPYANLPVAVPTPDDLESFRDFLRTVAAEFHIDGAENLKPPDWRVML